MAAFLSVQMLGKKCSVLGVCSVKKLILFLFAVSGLLFFEKIIVVEIRKDKCLLIRWNLFMYLLRYLDQETEMWPFLSSSQAATCFYLPNRSKEEAVPLCALPKNTISELACLISTLSFIAEHEAWKLWIPTFKVFWSDSTRKSKPVLPTMRRTLKPEDQHAEPDSCPFRLDSKLTAVRFPCCKF